MAEMDNNNLKYYENNCRTCLGINGKMLSIYYVDGEQNPLPIYEKLVSFTNLKISKNDAFPKTICVECFEKINNAISFKNQCESIEHFLNNLEINKDMVKNKNDKSENNKNEEIKVTENEKEFAHNADKISELYSNEVEGVYCTYCNKTFKNRGGFVKHRIVIHKINKQSTCPICSKTEFLSVNLLMQHQKEEHNIKRPWSCKLCVKTFATKTGLDYHVSKHDNVIKKFKCTLCSRSFKLKCNLNVHLKTSHKTNSKRISIKRSLQEHLPSIQNENYNHACVICRKTLSFVHAKVMHKDICEICSKKYASEVLLKKDLEKQHSIMENDSNKLDYTLNKCETESEIKLCYKCKLCKKDFKTNAEKFEHVKHAHTKFRYKSNLCNICGKCFASSYYLRDHMRIHSGVKPFKCPHGSCSSAFVTKVGLESHLKLAHSNVRPYLCTECGAAFKTKSSLQIHTRTHTGEKPYICKICGKCYRASGHLRHHLLMHDGGDPQSCQICNKILSNKSSFRSHMRNHENPKAKGIIADRPFVCSDCDKTFILAKDLKIHEMLHSGELPFRCEVCGTGFNRASNYKKHMLRHSDKRPHVCEHCGAGFVMKYLMVSHINKAHIGVRSFQCDMCPSAFFDTTGLGKHKQKVHNILKRDLYLSSRKLSKQDEFNNHIVLKDSFNDVTK